jgi:hypothetical protein
MLKLQSICGLRFEALSWLPERDKASTSNDKRAADDDQQAGYGLECDEIDGLPHDSQRRDVEPDNARDIWNFGWREPASSADDAVTTLV